MSNSKLRSVTAVVALGAMLLCDAAPVFAQEPSTKPDQQQSQLPESPKQQPQQLPEFNVTVPKSHNPFAIYMPSDVSRPALNNSPRLYQLIRDGKLYISLQDAIYLALEDNLDLAIARYNIPIADTDMLRTKAGGIFRGVNTGVVQGTPGGGVGGFGSGAPGAGAGGTTAGAGGAGAGASGLVQSTLGVGAPVSSYDPVIFGTVGAEHQTSPLANQQIYGVPLLQSNTGVANFGFSQAFASGTNFSFEFNNNRQTTNSPFFNLSPALGSMYRVSLQQQLLSGFGFGPN